jgi:hypothetical protein
VDLIKELDKKIEPKLDKLRIAFKKIALQIIDKEKKQFASKYPFVKKIRSSMGSVYLIDRNGVHLPDVDEDILDKLIEQNPQIDEATICEEYGKLRIECVEHRPVKLLRDLQYHSLGFCHKDIIFGCD